MKELIEEVKYIDLKNKIHNGSLKEIIKNEWKDKDFKNKEYRIFNNQKTLIIFNHIEELLNHKSNSDYKSVFKALNTYGV